MSLEKIIKGESGDNWLQKVNAGLDKVNDHASQLSNSVQQIKNTSVPYDYQGAVFTFIVDDGTSEFINNGFRALHDEKNIKASLAVVTSWIDSSSSYFTLEELKDLQNNGYEIISHSKTHSTSIFKASVADLTTVTDATLETEFKESQQWLKNNGFTGYNYMAYPWGNFGTENIRYKRLARKYYKYALNGSSTSPYYNTSPIDNMFGQRYFISLTQDFTTVLKPIIDTAVANNGWLILSYHAHDSANVSIEYLTTVLDYINSLGIPTLTFGEACEYKGNALSVGEFTSEQKFYVGNDGTTTVDTSASNTLKIVTTTDAGSMDDAITTYDIGKVTTVNIPWSKDTLLSKGGVMEVHRSEPYFSFALFYPTNASYNTVYKRIWIPSTNTWGSWAEIITDTSFTTHLTNSQALKIVAGTYNGTMDDLINVYDAYKETTVNIPWSKDTLLSKGGVMKVCRNDNYYQYSLYYPTNSNAIYRRLWNASNSTWGAWGMVGTPLCGTTTARQAIVTTTLSIGQTFFDTTLNKPLWVKSISPTVWVDATGTTV